MPPRDRGPWNVLTYIVGDDQTGGGPLDAAARRDIKAICEAADLKGLPVSVQVDFRDQPGVFRASLETARKDFEVVNPERYDLWSRLASNLVESELTLEKERRDLNSADQRTLGSFVRYANAQHPGRRSLLYFFGHSSGPLGMFSDKTASERRPRELRLNQLAKALDREEARIEIVVFRDCFMNTLETAYELRGVVRFIIGTQAEAPIPGQWPWVGLTAALMSSASADDAADAVALQLGAYFKTEEGRTLVRPRNGRELLADDIVDDVPYSLVSVDSVDRCTGPLKSLVTVLDGARHDAAMPAYRDALENSRCSRAGKTGDPALLDARTMCRNLMALGSSDAVYEPAAQLDAALSTDSGNGPRVIQRHHSVRPQYTGVSLYYRPWRPQDVDDSYLAAPAGDPMQREDDENYRQLAMCRETGWHELALRPLGDAGAGTS